MVKRGFRCPVPRGFTQEGLGIALANNRANPYTGAGLSWYINAPRIDMDMNWMGSAFVCEPLKWWRLPKAGIDYPVYAKMNNLLRVFCSDPVVERSFCEFMWAPLDSPLGKDIPYDPAITASPSAGLREARGIRTYTKC